MSAAVLTPARPSAPRVSTVPAGTAAAAARDVEVTLHREQVATGTLHITPLMDGGAWTGMVQVESARHVTDGESLTKAGHVIEVLRGHGFTAARMVKGDRGVAVIHPRR
jgi:hypothetical protein